MLLKNDTDVRYHAGSSNSHLSLLEKFMLENPQLVPVKWDGRGAFCQQMWHIAFLNHREYSSGMEPECCYKRGPIETCITDHSELWQDRKTLDLVHVAHPYCDGTDQGFLEGVEFLAKRGLNCVMSEASWYYPGRANLVIVARPRTLERIVIGDHLHLSDQNEEWDTIRVVAVQKAGEQVDADRWFAKAIAVEASGDYRYATLLFVDAAHTERTGRFHRQAVTCLREAARLLRDHYDDVVRAVATQSFLTQADSRTIFRLAGMEVPTWLKRIWRNSRRTGAWTFRRERNEDVTGWIEYYRCVICEEWIEAADSVYSSFGSRHSNRDCLAEVAGIPAE